jgi:bifunctional non-homologous end joining protein LigD
MAATLVDRPFDHPNWIFEPKFDGLRVLTRFDGRDLALLSRNGRPQESLFPDVAAALRAALTRPAVLDGEVVCFDGKGRTSFRALQQLFHLLDPAEVRARAERFPASVFLFDLLWLDGADLTGRPLVERKRLLREAVAWSERVRWTEYRAGQGKALFREACRRGEEGVIGKLLTSPYVGRRDPAWVKVKCLGLQEFVIGGFTDPQRSRVGIGALLVGYYEGGRLVYAGKVGTGYTRETLLALRRRLDRLVRPRSPFEAGGAGGPLDASRAGGRGRVRGVDAERPAAAAAVRGAANGQEAARLPARAARRRRGGRPRIKGPSPASQ